MILLHVYNQITAGYRLKLTIVAGLLNPQVAVHVHLQHSRSIELFPANLTLWLLQTRMVVLHVVAH